MKIHLTRSISSAFKKPLLLFCLSILLLFMFKSKLILLFFFCAISSLYQSPHRAPITIIILLFFITVHHAFSFSLSFFYNGWMNNKRNTNLIFNGSSAQARILDEMNCHWFGIQCVHKILTNKIYWNGKKGISILKERTYCTWWPFKAWYII